MKLARQSFLHIGLEGYHVLLQIQRRLQSRLMDVQSHQGARRGIRRSQRRALQVLRHWALQVLSRCYQRKLRHCFQVLGNLGWESPHRILGRQMVSRDPQSHRCHPTMGAIRKARYCPPLQQHL